MKSHKNRKRAVILAGALAVAAWVSGCGGRTGDLVFIPNNSYERDLHTSTEVYKGTLSASFSMKLKAEGYSRENYSMKDPGLEIDQVYVSVGDRVQEGDVLMTFKNEGLIKKMEARQEDMDQKELLIAHYKKLMNADKKLNYKSDIEALELDMEVDALYLQEYQELLDNYQVKARGNGTIIYVSDSAKSGIYTKGEKLISQACGTGNYTASTKELYEFTEGESFTAVCGVAEYTVQVSHVETTSDGDGNITSNVTFVPISDMSAVAENESLKVVVQQDIADEVVYVETKAVHKIYDRYYVQTLDENDYTTIVWVKPGEELGEYTVIAEGLEGGERVVLK